MLCTHRPGAQSNAGSPSSSARQAIESPILPAPPSNEHNNGRPKHAQTPCRGIGLGPHGRRHPSFAQAPETFTAPLAWVPIGGAERNDVAGEGSATATLSGSRLSITGSFEGLPAKATAAKLHQGIATGARGRGAAIADLRVTGGASGTVSGDVRLSAEQLAALKAGQLYLQIYSEKGVLPDHGTLWGWLLQERGARR